MELKLKLGSEKIGVRCIMALITVIAACACAFLGQLGFMAIPLAAAPMATLFILEIGRRRPLSIIVPILAVALDALLNGISSFSCLAAVLVAALAYIALSTGFFSKGDSAVAATVLVSLLVFASAIAYGCIAQQSFTLESSLEFYRQLASDLRAQWMAASQQYLESNSGGEPIDQETLSLIGDMFDGYVQSIYSGVMIFAFILVGFSYKLFVSLVSRYVERKSTVYRWRFALSPIYAIAYASIYVLQMFADGTDRFSLIVYNLVNVFTLIFAYMGFLFADAYFKMRSEGRGGGKLLIVLAIMMFGSVAWVLLSFVGAFASYAMHKSGVGVYDINDNQGGNDEQQK